METLVKYFNNCGTKFRILGGVSEGDIPFMFISPSDINFKNMADFLPKNVSQTTPIEEKQSAQLSPAYQQLLDANPYRNYSYEESPWQALLSGLGFRTGADAYRENMQIQAAEYDSQIKLMNFQNMFNSEAAKSARMRAAGENPDLLGTGDVSDSASPPEDGNPPISSEDDITSITQFANQVMSCFTTAVGISKDLGALNSIMLGNEEVRLKNAASYFSLAQDAILNSTSRTPGPNGINLDWNNLDRLGASVFGWRSRKHKKFNDVVRNVFNGIPTEKKQFQAWYDTVTARKSGYMAARSSDYDDSAVVMNTLAKHLGKFAKDTKFWQAEGEKWKAWNDDAYQKNFDAIGAAETANAVNEGNKAQAEARESHYNRYEAFNNYFDDMIKDLEGLADDGNIVASATMCFIQMLRFKYLAP